MVLKVPTSRIFGMKNIFIFVCFELCLSFLTVDCIPDSAAHELLLAI